MIEKVANNRFNTEVFNPNSPQEVKEKLDYYRSLFGKVQNLSAKDFEALKGDISTFFNLKPAHLAANPPERLVRISNNNNILAAQGKPLSYLTDITQLLAPPIDFCQYGRCNILNQQVLYCALDEASAYWETKPKNGDVISISHFKLKEGAKINCSVITNKEDNRNLSTQLLEIFYLLDDFFIDAYSLLVDKNRPKDYIFSALLSSAQLFYPISSADDIKAIIYPSVQKKKFGHNFAIRNDLIFEKYDLIAVETRFILDEFKNIDPNTWELITDDLIGSIATYTFDLNAGKILYDNKMDEIFPLFRQLQINGKKQVRFDNPDNVKRIPFNLSKRTISGIANITDANKNAGQSHIIGGVGLPSNGPQVKIDANGKINVL